MAKKSGLTTCDGGQLGDDPQDRNQLAPMLPTGQESIGEAEDIENNEGEEEDNGALLIPGISERG